MDKNLLKKTMTKKQYKALMRKNRSVVTKGQNTGTVSHRSKVNAP